MSKLSTVIVTTELPPAVCGIGTYSWLLHQHSPNESSAEFLVSKSGLGNHVTSFNGDAGQLAAALDRVGPANLLLHYSGRAYHSLGIPWWMPRVLAKWKRKFPDSRLAIIVHEIPAEFPVSSRHFWLGKLSERVLARLSRIAEVLVTNSPHHAERLRKISGRDDVHRLPNPSNIEMAPAETAPRAHTEFVIFGLSFGRLQTLRLFQSRIGQWQAAGILTKLHLIGPAEGEFARQGDELVDPAIVVHHGQLASSEIARMLRRAGFALTNASEKTWSQSTTFMACAANECPIVAAGSESVPNTISADEVATISADEIARRTRALAEWYRREADWPVIAARLATLLA